MSAWPLIVAGALAGGAATLHCAAMCQAPQRLALRGIPIVRAEPAGGSATLGCGTTAGDDAGLWWLFQGGRVTGYAMLGLLAGAVGQQWLAVAAWQGLFESAWAALNAALLIGGIAMLLSGREPTWLARLPARAGRAAPPRAGSRAIAAWRRGAAWALLPCGTLYSALALALLAGTPLGAAAVMLAFGLGTSAGLAAAHAGWDTIARRFGAAGAYRIQGLLLAVAAAVGLGAALVGATHPFCS
ncbi:MAG: sulfite exporter TauE/SafE family protein [Lautropia sp.]